MNHKLLGSVAALTLLASVGMAYAQSGDGNQPRDTQPRDAKERHAPEAGQKGDHPKRAAENGAPDAKRTGPGKERRAEDKAPDARSAEKKKDRSDPDAGKRADDRQKKDQPDRADRDRGEQGHRADRVDGDRGDRKRADRDPAVDVKLDPEKRARIFQRARDAHVDVIRNVDFDVRLGGVIPPRVRVNRLPPEIVTLVPQYRGYDYVVANDVIIITEPETHRIVYTIPEGRSAAAMDHRSTDCR